MATLTIRLPDDKHQRLRQLAKHRKISINKLIEELSTLAAICIQAQPGDQVLIMSNGGFGGIHAKLLAALKRPYQ